MRVLIDACLPVQFKEQLGWAGSKTARELGWQRLKNGELLAAAAGNFDVLITMDKSLPSQQLLAQHGIAVFVLRARSNRLEDLIPLVPKIISALPDAAPGRATVIA